MNKVIDSYQNRIDNLAIAYVQAHYDVTKLTATEFVKKVAEAQHEIADYIASTK